MRTLYCLLIVFSSAVSFTAARLIRPTSNRHVKLPELRPPASPIKLKPPSRPQQYYVIGIEKTTNKLGSYVTTNIQQP